MVTDKPSPITTALAQGPAANETKPAANALLQMERSDADNLSVLFDHNVTRGALKNLVTNKAFARAMQVNNVPHTFLVNADGEVVWQHNNYADGDEEELYEELLKLAE